MFEQSRAIVVAARQVTQRRRGDRCLLALHAHHLALEWIMYDSILFFDDFPFAFFDVVVCTFRHRRRFE